MEQMLFSQIQQAPGPNFRKVEKSLDWTSFGVSKLKRGCTCKAESTKCHIVGNHKSRLIYVLVEKKENYVLIAYSYLGACL